MLTERAEKLQELQKIKEKVYADRLEVLGKKNSTAEQKALKKIKKIEIQIANLNKLDVREKNIHAIWLKTPSQNHIDNLKLWAKYNPKYIMHLWTDSTHILTDKLNEIIIENAKNSSTPYETEANLKDKFYYNYHLKNLNQTFDENAMQFLIVNKYATEAQVLNWIKEGKEKNNQNLAEINKYANNRIVLHDIAKEKDNIFFSKRYEKGYLRELEKLHLSEAAVNKLSYAILDKFGGVYLDTSVMPKFNLKKIKANKKIRDLINEIKWDEYDNDDIVDKKTDIILNQIITFKKLKQLNDEKLTAFTKNWEEKFGSEFINNYDNNFNIFKKIANRIKSKNFTSKPKKNLDNFPISNILQFGVEFYNPNTTINNTFLISKANSKFLQEVMDGIEAVDEKIKTWDTKVKLINQNNMIAFHSGPENLINRIQENDIGYYFDTNNSEFATVANIDFYNNKNSFYEKCEKFEDIAHTILKKSDSKYYIKDAKDKFLFSKEEVLSYKKEKKEQEKFRKQLRTQDAIRKGKRVRWEDELQIPREKLQEKYSPSEVKSKSHVSQSKKAKPRNWEDLILKQLELVQEKKESKAKKVRKENRMVTQKETLQGKSKLSSHKNKQIINWINEVEKATNQKVQKDSTKEKIQDFEFEI